MQTAAPENGWHQEVMGRNCTPTFPLPQIFLPSPFLSLLSCSLFIHVLLSRFSLYNHFYAHQGECQLLGDLMVLLRAVGAFECSSNKEIFCKRHCLRLKALLEIRKLRQQLTNIGMCVCMCVRTVC